jgi:hypothetical protein
MAGTLLFLSTGSAALVEGLTLRYTELNPVRAGLAHEARLWKWSSAAVHCGLVASDDCLAEEPWRSQWTAKEWQAYLALGETESEIAEIRQYTHTGRPLGTEEFVLNLERSSNRRLTPLRVSRGQVERIPDNFVPVVPVVPGQFGITTTAVPAGASDTSTSSVFSLAR